MAPNERSILKQLNDGSFFGAISIVLDCRCVASVVAGTYCLTYSIQRDIVLMLIEKDASIGAKLDADSNFVPWAE